MVRASELRVRDVVDVTDGRRLGNVADLEIDLETGCVTGLIVPGASRLFGLLGSEGEALVPWDDVVTIGADVILVRRAVRPSATGGSAR